MLKYITGIITDKTLLPVTSLNFGRIVHPSSSGVHTLGRFECTGQAAFSDSANGMPKSCADLLNNGHIANGLYLIMGREKVETVFCDFYILSSNFSKSTFTSFSKLFCFIYLYFRLRHGHQRFQWLHSIQKLLPKQFRLPICYSSSFWSSSVHFIGYTHWIRHTYGTYEIKLHNTYVPYIRTYEIYVRRLQISERYV